MADDQIPEAIDPALLLHGLTLHDLLRTLVRNDLLQSTDRRFFAVLDRLGDPRQRSDQTNRRVERLLHIRDGLLAAQYHRDRIESIEREIVKRVREAAPAPWRPGSSASIRMPIVSHEYVAFLLACRRTLDYLARAVATCFARDTYRIKRLAPALADAGPPDLAAQAIRRCADLQSDFPDLLTQPGNLSERDRAAHHWPVEPAYLLIVFFEDGRTGIELRDGGGGHLPTANTLDPDRMTRDEPLLTASLDARLDRLTSFCVDLTETAVEAELRRIAAVDRE